MAPNFARSISLSLSPNHKKSSYHVRSVSLPCRSHPFISNLEEQIQAVRSWATNPEATSAWIEAGLMQIELLYTALEDFLQRSETKETLSRSVSVDQLLDDFLQLVDFYGLFLSNLEELKQCNSEVQSALRRQDIVQMGASLRSQRHIEKQMAQLVSGLRGMTKSKQLSLSSDAKEIETTGIMIEAISATAFASMTIFKGAATLSSAGSSTKMISVMKSMKTFTTTSFLERRSTDVEALGKLEGLEESIMNIKFSSEHVYRSLINSRMSLLNITTSSL
jgi:Arabidopsis protein of unknown function